MLALAAVAGSLKRDPRARKALLPFSICNHTTEPNSAPKRIAMPTPTMCFLCPGCKLTDSAAPGFARLSARDHACSSSLANSLQPASGFPFGEKGVCSSFIVNALAPGPARGSSLLSSRLCLSRRDRDLSGCRLSLVRSGKQPSSVCPWAVPSSTSSAVPSSASSTWLILVKPFFLGIQCGADQCGPEGHQHSHPSGTDTGTVPDTVLRASAATEGQNFFQHAPRAHVSLNNLTSESSSWHSVCPSNGRAANPHLLSSWPCASQTLGLCPHGIV